MYEVFVGYCSVLSTRNSPDAEGALLWPFIASPPTCTYVVQGRVRVLWYLFHP